ncbi:MAG: hypothetical protein AAGF12_37190 [Myxococcota bacterium]
MKTKPSAVGLAILLSACAVDVEPAGRQASAIRAGYDDLDQPVENATVSDGNCTGTLISPTKVLTAGHCTFGNAPGDFLEQTDNKDGFAFGEQMCLGDPTRREIWCRPLGGLQQPWTATPPAAPLGTRDLAASNGRTYALAGSQIYLRVSGSPFVLFSNATNLTHIGAAPDGVYGIDGSGRLLRRAVSGLLDSPWSNLGSGASGAEAFAVDSYVIEGTRITRFYMAQGGRLFAREASTSWTDVGPAQNIVALAADDGRLFGWRESLTPGQASLEMRLATPYEQPWQRLAAAAPETDAVGLAADEHRVLRADQGGQVFDRARWGAFEPIAIVPPADMVGMTSHNSTLWAITRNGHIHEYDGSGWRVVGASVFGVTTLTYRSGDLYFAAPYRAGFRIYAWPIGGGSLSVVEQVSFRVDHLEWSDGQLFAVSGDRLYRRSSSGSWSDRGEFDSDGLASVEDDLHSMKVYGQVRHFDRGTWRDEHREDWEHPLRRYAPDRPRNVFVGAEWGSRTAFRIASGAKPTHADARMLFLETPVPASLALPTQVLLDPPTHGNLSAFWRDERVTGAGWGNTIRTDPRNQILRRGSLSFSSIRDNTPAFDISVALPPRPPNPAAGEVEGPIFMVGINGSLQRLPMNPAGSPVSLGSPGEPLTSVAAIAETFAFGVAGRELYTWQENSAGVRSWTEVTGSGRLSDALLPGERPVAAAYVNGRVYIATDSRRLYSRSGFWGAWRLETTLSYVPDSMAGDGNYLYTLRNRQWIYRNDVRTAWSWTYTASVPSGWALGAQDGHLFASNPSLPKRRQAADGTDVEYPWGGRPGMMSVREGILVLPGDSGGPLYWTYAGTRYVVGIAQGHQANGDSHYTATWAPPELVDNETMYPNVSGWIHTHLTQ